jgi:hypothetical protein
MKTESVTTSTSRRGALQGLALGIVCVTCLMVAPAQGESADDSESADDTELPILSAADTKALIGKEGQKVVVIGKCERTGKSRGGTNFVNFVDSDFVLVTFKSDLGPFADGEPADLYKGKYLSVTGVIDIYKDAPQIKLVDPAQVKASDQAFEVPPPKAEQAKAEGEAKKAADKAKADKEGSCGGNK